MSDERWLITGALGCIGAWACRQLVREGHDVIAYDLGDDTRRLELVMDAGERSSVRLVSGDITDLEALTSVVERERITHIVHLAALLLPIARADPPRGALVNVVGTVNVFEAASRSDVQGVAYASSAAAYDRADGVHVTEDADGHPLNHYGVHKLANEGAARVYWHDAGLASVGLRPHVVYGPGRDHGMTAGPTLAIAAAVAGDPYEIPFGGRAQFQYAPDTAGLFIKGARSAAAGKRLIDVLAIHWYPEDMGDSRINNGNVTNGGSAKDIEARLQAPRSLWDTAYLENSWIPSAMTGGKPVYILARTLKSIDTAWPGTRLALTEYN